MINKMRERKALFIVWGNFSPRAEGFVAHFGDGIMMRFVHYPRLKKSLLLLPLRYLASAMSTWHILRTYRPRIVFVQNPAIFAPLVVFLYSRVFKGVRFVIDSHSSCFNSPAWNWSLPLQRWLSKYASVTLVHNEEVLEYTRHWPGKILVVDDAPLKVMSDVKVHPSDDFKKIVVISSFAWDEPIDLVLKAAASMPDVEFYITGDYTRGGETLLSIKPANVFFTGFVPRAEYFLHLCSANAVMVLTTRDHTMQRGAWEALYCGQPLILSDQRTLRSYFDKGTIFVPNTVEGIVEGVEEMRHREKELRDEMIALALLKRQRWLDQIEELRRIIDLPAILDEEAKNKD